MPLALKTLLFCIFPVTSQKAGICWDETLDTNTILESDLLIFRKI